MKKNEEISVHSAEELFKSIDKHAHYILALKELDVCRAPDKGIEILLVDAEVHIDPVKHFEGQVRKQVPCHLDVDLTLVSIVSRLITDLDPG